MEGEEICRLCLKVVPESDFVNLDDGQDMLSCIIPGMNIMNSATGISGQICRECFEGLQTSYKFKTFCIERKRDFKHSKCHQTANVVQNSECNKCCLCWDSTEIGDSTQAVVENEQVSLKLMLEECIPDLNVHPKDNLTQCAKCSASLKNMFCFIKRSKQSREKYKNSMKLDGKEGEMSYVSDSTQFCFVKIENSDTKNEKGETSNDQTDPLAGIKKEKDDDEYEELIEDNDFRVKTELIEGEESEQELTDIEFDKVKFCENETTTKLTPPYKCTQCRYKTDILHRFETHMLKHQDPLNIKKFKCTVCLYEAKYNYHIQDHMLTHLDPSETTMFKCYNCSFETKRKSVLKMHLVTHKDPSELKMFKCQSCSFMTKWRDCLKKHQARHQSLNEGITYKCEFCSYVTNKKHLLRPHLLRHKNPSDITMYKCDWCPYEAKQKSNLQKHLVKHKEPSEITMYKCDICSYATKWQSGIKAHRMRHRKRHKCDKCPYEADEKNDLLQHLLSHPEGASLKIYSCDQCPYSTRYKTNLNKHLNTHKDSSEVPTFQCDLCSYMTKHKTALKNHAFVHMDTSDMTVFKCELCSYKTFRKIYLLKHVDRHKVAKEEGTDLE